jgi:holo-[acyl-carrier protein] synthase
MTASTSLRSDLSDHVLSDHDLSNHDLFGALARLSAGLDGWRPASSLRVGIDVTSVAEVAESVERFGHRYVHRIFTPHEVACSRRPGPGGGPSTYAIDSLAARFAAKEAVVKVLRPTGHRPEWRAIEVYRAPTGWTEIRLSGSAARLASRTGIGQMALSLTHQGSLAAAVVVGVCHGSDRSVSLETPTTRREV